MKRILSCSKLASPLSVMLILLACNISLHAQQNKFENQSKKIDEVIKKEVHSSIDESISELRKANAENSTLKSAFATTALSMSDSLVLVKLFNDTDGPNWTNNSNWLSNQPVRTWYGITVSGDNITEIKLKENNLTGSIPAELGQLTSLQFLSLDTNNLSGNIPAELGNLTNLDYLYLSGNQLSGNIPTELGNLNTLLLLYLAGNNLDGTIPASLGNLSAMRWLDLAENELTGNIPQELEQLSALEYLDFSINNLSGNVPAGLANLLALKWLVLSTNQFSGTIPTELGDLENLEMLYLNGNQISGEIPAELNNLTKLRWLNLGQNQLTGSLPSGLSNLSNLELLYLNENILTGSISSELGSMPKLRWMNLGTNQLTGSIPDEIWKPNFSLLYLDNNKLTGSLPSLVGSMMNIEWMNLNSNSFTGSIPSEISQLNKLKILKADSNQFDELPYINVPGSLTDLTVFGNKLSFEDLEHNMDLLPSVNFLYAPQDSIGTKETIYKNEGETFSYSLITGGTQNQYQWYKDGELLSGQISENLLIEELTQADAGNYHCLVTNSTVPGLTLTSREITLSMNKCIKLKFLPGWNIFSTPVLADIKDMESFFQPFINNKSLVKIQDESGNSLEDRGIFGGWTNTIGDIVSTEGYSVKMITGDSILICGRGVEFPFAIPLKKGWNVISYPHMSEHNGLTLVQQLIDREVLLKVQDETGKSIEDFGIYGGWKNNIGNFVPGEGYKIKVSEDDVLTVLSSYPKSEAIHEKSTASTYFKPVFEGNGINHMNINLVDLAETEIMEGDEIGIFDGNICVGSSKVTARNHSFISLIASAHDGAIDLNNGFKQGNNLTMKLYRQGNEFPLMVQPLNNSNLQFEKNGTLFVSVKADFNTGTQIQDNDFGVNLFPNPFQDLITLNINLPHQEKLDVEIYDLNSRRIRQIYSGLANGAITLQWDGSDAEGNKVANGMYLCRINKIWKKVIFNGK